MRILLVTDNFPPVKWGGMAAHAVNVARFLAQRHTVRVVTLQRQASSEHAAEPFDVRAVLTKRFPALDFGLVGHIARRFRADVLHVCTAGLIDVGVSRHFPVVTRTVGNDFLRPWCGYHLPLRSLLYRLPGARTKAAVQQRETSIRVARVREYLLASAVVVANSAWTRERLLQVGIPVEGTRTIIGGVDTQVFQPCKFCAPVRERLDLPVDEPVIVTAANLIAKKGIDTLVKAIARLTEYSGLRLVVVGEGPDRERLRRVSRDCGVTDRVLFVGRKSQAELATYYNAADVYVLASQEESMGRTYFEAGACGIPVVGARVGGVPDVVRHGENGFLVNDPEDVDAVADCIRRLLTNPQLRNRMGAAGLKRAREEFSWERVGAAFEEVMLEAPDVWNTKGSTADGIADRRL